MKDWQINTLNTFLVITLVIALTLSFWNIWNGYSYWLDELFSVNVSKGTLTEMYSFWLQADVHPPLYQNILWLYLKVFPHHEVSTRLFSFILAIAAFLLFSSYLKQKADSNIAWLCSIAFFSSCWLFPYFAQEVRSYSLLLLLATATTFMLISKQKNLLVFSILLVLLSLTHYFGTLYALIVLFIDLLRSHEKPKQVVVHFSTLILILIWPVFHLSTQSLREKLAGNFYIDTIAGIGTFDVFLKGLFYPLYRISFILAGYSGIPRVIILSTILLLFIALVINLIKAGRLKHFLTSELNLIAITILIFLISTSILDYYTPVSTDKNFIVLLPAVSILFYHVVSRFLIKNKAFFLLVPIYLVSSLHFSFSLLKGKWEPFQNWKETGRIVNTIGSNMTVAVMSTPKEVRFGLLINYYIEDTSKHVSDVLIYTQPELQDFDIVLGLWNNQVNDYFKASNSENYYSFNPKQHLDQYHTIFIKKNKYETFLDTVK